MANCTLNYSLKQKKNMPIHAFIPYLLSVCTTITVKLDTELNDKFFLNSAVTLTSNFQGQMVNSLCLKNAWHNLHETKTVWINWLIYFMYDLGHWPCLWPWPSISNVKSWNCHIYEMSDLVAKKVKEGECLEWCDILLIISNLRFAFIMCSSAVRVWRFGR